MADRYFAFISYANVHREWVAKLQKDLEHCLDHYARTVDPSISQKVFLDQVDLQSGRTWIDQFQEAVDQSERLILVVSPVALASRWVRIEWQSFFTKRPEDVFPVRIAEAELTTFLDPIQWIDFIGLEGTAYNQRLQQFFGDLLRRKRRDPPPMPLEFALPAEDSPESTYASEATRELSLQLEGAYEQRAEILASGGDPTQVNETIVGLKRKLREGPQLEAGDFLLDGRFKLLETLGRGGFATVWKAYDRERQNLAAVKVLHSQYSKDQSRRDRFFRGARQMANLRHPGIVSVVETECEDGGYHFFAMEYLAGGDFRQAVLDGRLSCEERLRVVLAIGEALSYAHSRGVIHRDVKPANILLDLEGHAKLTDFDLVRAADTTGGTGTAMLGTIVYAAPEAMLDGKQAAEPADVYGLGMTALFAMHGKDLSVDVLYEPKALIGSLSLSPTGRSALARALERDASGRWGGVEEFRATLEAAEFPDSIAKPAPPSVKPKERPSRSIRRSPGSRGPKTQPSRKLSTTVFWGTLLLFVSALPVGYLVGQWSPWRSDGPTSPADTLQPVGGFTEPPQVPPHGEQEQTDEPVRTARSQPGLMNPQITSETVLPAHCQAAEEKTGIELVYVPAGTYPIGEDERYRDVELGAFWIGKHPVTNKQYRRFVESGHELPGYWSSERFNAPDQPVVGVSWSDAMAFASWAGFVLPSEEQWEAAARGLEGHIYPWGNEEPTLELADFGKSYSTGRPDPVGSHPEGAGPFGAEDQAGGVWEWCVDELEEDNYRPLRGGAWNAVADDLRSAFRLWVRPGDRVGLIGFRVLCAPPSLAL